MGSFHGDLIVVSDQLGINISTNKRVIDIPNSKIERSEKVSIIMPVYNGEKYLKAAIDSIISQSLKDWELIVINDGSTDNTENIISQYDDDRIKYTRNDTNLGLVATLNKAITFCSGIYIARMDADDICEKDRLLKQFIYLETHPLVAMCGTNAIIIDDNGNKKGNIINVSSNDYIQINLLFSVPIIHPSVMFRSYVLKNDQYNKEYKHIEDYELWCRIADKYPISNLSSKLLRYRWHSSNVSVLYNQQQEELKNKVITNQLHKLGLRPSQEELFLHRISFMQYDAKGDIKEKKFDDFNRLNTWFKKIIKANNEEKKYNQKKLIAFLWSRWIVLCIKQKQYKSIFSVRFVPFNLTVYFETCKLMIILLKK